MAHQSFATPAATRTHTPAGQRHTGPPDPRARALLAEHIAGRRARLALLQDDMIAACEHAALTRSSTKDRGQWDRHAWRRYLAEASRFAATNGAVIRRLQADIARLQRLADLGVQC